jgi:hypothetical protein
MLLFDGIEESSEVGDVPSAAANQGSMDGEAAQQAQVNGSAAAKSRCATAADLKRTLVAQDFRCALSGQELTLDNVTIDHIRPIAEGGDDSAGNLQLVERDVNRMKGTLSLNRFVRLCCLVARWHEAVRPVGTSRANEEQGQVGRVVSPYGS